MKPNAGPQPDRDDVILTSILFFAVLANLEHSPFHTSMPSNSQLEMGPNELAKYDFFFRKSSEFVSDRQLDHYSLDTGKSNSTVFVSSLALRAIGRAQHP